MKCWKRVNAMIVRTLPLDLQSVHADGSLLSRRGGASRAAGHCLVALALSAALASCGAEQSSNPLTADDPLAEPAGEQAIRAADCSATGTVANLPANDDFLAVRTGPGTNYREVARLGAGVEMHLCTPAKDNRWVGVIYRPDGELPDADRCRLTTDDSPRYEGPCRSGWVSARYVAHEGAEPVVGRDSLGKTSFYVCEKEEGHWGEANRRVRVESIPRGYYLSDVFEAPANQAGQLRVRYTTWVVERERFPDTEAVSLDWQRGNYRDNGTCWELDSRENAEIEHGRLLETYGGVESIIFRNSWQGE